MRTIEEDHQIALFQWANTQTTYPELRLMFAIPNGGQRHKVVAAKLKAGGVRAGVPDIFLPVPREQYHGLFIEMKKPKTADSARGATSDKQLEWIDALQRQLYCAEVAYGWEHAVQIIKEYM